MASLTATRPQLLRAPRVRPARPAVGARRLRRSAALPVGLESVDGLVGSAVGAVVTLADAGAVVTLADAGDAPHEILKGTALALAHPVGMGALLALTTYAGWLGLLHRETRDLAGEIKGLRALAKDSAGEAVALSASDDQALADKTARRKQLIGDNVRDRHADAGFLLLGGGVTLAIAGCLNTYTRTGKLFPGPHLFAGAGVVVLWALAASLTPAMQKGNDTARSLHIAANVANVGLFLWQVPTGLEIVGKVFEFTTWP